jgi:hypothetical protein
VSPLQISYLPIDRLIHELCPRVRSEGICKELPNPTLQFLLPVMLVEPAGLVQARIVEIFPSGVVGAAGTQSGPTISA